MITRPRLVADRPGNLESLDDIHERAVIERERAFAVGEPAEGDHSDQIVGPAGKAASSGTEHEIRDHVLDGLEPADVAAVELKIDGLHRAGHVEHQLDGDALAGNPRFGFARLRPCQPDNHQAEAESKDVGPQAAQRCASVTGRSLSSATLENSAAALGLAAQPPPNDPQGDGEEDQPVRSKES